MKTSCLVAVLLLAACSSNQSTPIVDDRDVGSDAGGQDMANADATTLPDDGVIPDSGGEDLGAPGPLGLIVGPCPEEMLTEDDALVVPAAVTLGDFTIDVQSDSLRVGHADTGDRSLFETPLGRPMFRIGPQDLVAEEHQGSFDVETNVGELCSEPRVQSAWANGDALALRGRFDDAACGDVTFEVHWCAGAETGHLRFHLAADDPDADLFELFTVSSFEEHIFGMGEQFPHDDLDLKGRVIGVLSQEGGVGRGHQPISAAVNTASPGSAGSEDTTYYAAPWYLTSEGRALFLENTEYAEFDFEASSQTSIRLFAPSMTGRIVAGNSPLEQIERFTEWAGRMPVPPDWVNDGAIIALARDLPESTQIVDELLAADVPISAVWNQTWSGTSETFIGEQVLWNWIQNPNRHPTWDTFIGDMADRGINTLCYINPMLRELPEDAGELRRHLYEEAEQNGYFVKNAEGTTYELEVTAFDVGLIDFTNPEARAWTKSIIRDELIDRAGCSGWMVDFAEALPFDAVLHDGTSAATYHNQYPVEWMRLNREAIEEAGGLGDIVTFNRAGAARTPRWSLLVWQGDQLTTWDKYDGLVSAMRGLIGSGFSGISLNHSDIGGYTSLSRFGLGYSREATQLKRWTEMAAFTAVMRTHEGNQPGENAQVYTDAEARAHFARMTNVYVALSEYRRTLFLEASERGWPVVRHMSLHYPDQPDSYTMNDQFMLGAQMIVAPIKNKCFNPLGCDFDKNVWLPQGDVWVHLWSGTTYDATSESMTVSVEAPYGEPAVFYRRDWSMADSFRSELNARGIVVASP